MEVLGCVGAVIVWVSTVVLRGWVLTVLWGWFVASTFNVRPLTITAAIGLSMIVAFLTAQYKPTKNTTSSKKNSWTMLAEQLVFAIIYPLLSLGIGYIVQLFM